MQRLFTVLRLRAPSLGESMKLQMHAELELPDDLFRGARATTRLEQYWLALMNAIEESAKEDGIKLLEVRCGHVRPRIGKGEKRAEKKAA